MRILKKISWFSAYLVVLFLTGGDLSSLMPESTVASSTPDLEI